MLTAKQQVAAALFATSSLIAVAPAQAQSTGWMGGRMDTNLYVGASIGQTHFNNTCDGVVVISCDDKDTGYKGFVGWQFHPNFAVEGGYYHLGEATLNGVGVTASAKVRGWELVGLAIFPVWQQLSLYGKVGAARSRVTGNSNLGISGSDNSTDFTYGLGAQYAFTRNVAARVEWQRYNDVGGSNVGKDDIDFFNASLLYRF